VKGEGKGVKILLATDHAALYGRESPVIKRASGAKWYVKAQQQHRVKRSSLG